MRLRNKRTGEIVIFGEGIIDLQKIGCKNVAEMMEAGWEDYKEPNIYYFIDIHGEIKQMEYHKFNWQDDMKKIGNYFETKEEAEKAMKKLKAWKRLKDKGFRFIDNKIIGEYGNVSYRLTYPATAIEEKDLDLLFGGEDE